MTVTCVPFSQSGWGEWPRIAQGRYHRSDVVVNQVKAWGDVRIDSPLLLPRGGGVASRSLLPVWQAQGGHDGKEGYS
jgi:hypothetical protein